MTQCSFFFCLRLFVIELTLSPATCGIVHLGTCKSTHNLVLIHKTTLKLSWVHHHVIHYVRTINHLSPTQNTLQWSLHFVQLWESLLHWQSFSRPCLDPPTWEAWLCCGQQVEPLRYCEHSTQSMCMSMCACACRWWHGSYLFQLLLYLSIWKGTEPNHCGHSP